MCPTLYNCLNIFTCKCSLQWVLDLVQGLCLLWQHQYWILIWTPSYPAAALCHGDSAALEQQDWPFCISQPIADDRFWSEPIQSPGSGPGLQSPKLIRQALSIFNILWNFIDENFVSVVSKVSEWSFTLKCLNSKVYASLQNVYYDSYNKYLVSLDAKQDWKFRGSIFT